MVHPVLELVSTRLREFLRQPETIFWVYGFPVLLAVCLGLAFRNSEIQTLHVGVVSTTDSLTNQLSRVTSLETKSVTEDEGKRRLAGGHIDALLIMEAGRPRVVHSPHRPRSLLAFERVNAAIQRAAGQTDPVIVRSEPLDQPGLRYIDFLFPGLIGINLMSGGLYGIGFVIVDMRVRKLLKRFLATPMRRRDFFTAILASRLFFLLPEMAFLLLIATLGFGMPVHGNLLAVFAVIFMSALSFAGLGLLVSSRARRVETISGLIKVVIIVMWLFGGVFFSTERFPELLQPVIKILPLTVTTNALRAVILDGSTLASQWAEILVLGCWSVASFVLSLRLFRWI
jgi:ABC-2 type transport system permease protein